MDRSFFLGRWGFGCFGGLALAGEFFCWRGVEELGFVCFGFSLSEGGFSIWLVIAGRSFGFFFATNLFNKLFSFCLTGFVGI